MAAGGPSAEERSYRRFLELFLGEFRGPFGVEPSPPSAVSVVASAGGPGGDAATGLGDGEGEDAGGAAEGVREEGDEEAAEEEEEEVQPPPAEGDEGEEAAAVDEDEDVTAAAAAAPQEEDDGGGSPAGEAQSGLPPPVPPPPPSQCAGGRPVSPPVAPLPSLPRPLSEHITEEEVEGECLDLCLQQLYK